MVGELNTRTQWLHENHCGYKAVSWKVDIRVYNHQYKDLVLQFLDLCRLSGIGYLYSSESVFYFIFISFLVYREPLGHCSKQGLL